MLSSVQSKISTEEFQITDWASQIAELQARIARSQSRITQLNEDNAVADGLLQAAQAAKGKIVDQDVIADLLAQLSQMLGGGDNGNDGNGNLPLEPAPQPNDDGGFGDVSALIAESSTNATQPEPLNQTVEMADEIAVQPEPLTGQSCEWASPWASPLASPLATPLCCQLSDTPQSALQGQSVEIACVVSDAPKKPEYIELVPISHSVAYQQRIHDGEIICCYVGFNNKTKAKQWGEFLAVHHSVASGFQLRASERLTDFKWEIKLWGMSLKQIEKLAETDLQKSPPSNFGTFPVRKVEPVAPAPKPLQIEDIGVGDIVRNTTVKNWAYVVLAKMENGMLDCQRNNTPVGTPEIRLALHPASVELVSKAIKVEDSEVSQHISIDVNDVPVGVKLERTDDALITEYRIWVWVVARVFGKPELQQKCIGSLIESTNGINAHRPHGMSTAQSYNRTFDAINHLVKGAGLKLADIEVAYNRHQEEVGLASIQPPVLQPQPVPDVQKIEQNDWVELLVNGARYQVDSVDSEGIHLACDSGNMLAQPHEVKLLMKIPANWQPF